jgi:hypothetical protein
MIAPLRKNNIVRYDIIYVSFYGFLLAKPNPVFGEIKAKCLNTIPKNRLRSHKTTTTKTKPQQRNLKI